jgi:2',3'-cyclic-nucleotide 2'-phosphodiesterase (5'-nucleotidase family)
MNNRRNFLIQGTLATSAMIAIKPLQTIAAATSRFTGASGSYGRIVFLHTADMDTFSGEKLVRYIKEIKNNNTGTILLKAGHDETGALAYDASMNETDDLSLMATGYKIINKAGCRTGIITAMPGENDIFQRVNALSSFLKKEKNCAMVVCLSRLGYTNSGTPDDISLAKNSTHLDIIIGGHDKNFQPGPYIALNQKNEEVIIHSAFGDSGAIGKIEIAVDHKGRKKQVSFTDRS